MIFSLRLLDQKLFQFILATAAFTSTTSPYVKIREGYDCWGYDLGSSTAFDPLTGNNSKGTDFCKRKCDSQPACKSFVVKLPPYPPPDPAYRGCWFKTDSCAKLGPWPKQCGNGEMPCEIWRKSSCNCLSCPAYGNIMHGNPISGETFIGETRKVTCKSGSYLAGTDQPSTVVVCTNRGTWNPTTVTCESKCKTPQVSPNLHGNLILKNDGPLHRVGQHPFQCHPNHYVDDQPTKPILCRDSGQFDPLPTCEAKCGQLPNPANGSVSPSLKTLNAANAYRVTCDKNYHIIGYPALWKNIICGPTGDWNGNMYSCERIECDNVFDTFTGEISSAAPYLSGNTYSFVCQDGLTLPAATTTRNYVCNHTEAKGYWNFDFAECQEERICKESKTDFGRPHPFVMNCCGTQIQQFPQILDYPNNRQTSKCPQTVKISFNMKGADLSLVGNEGKRKFEDIQNKTTIKPSLDKLDSTATALMSTSSAGLLVLLGVSLKLAIVGFQPQFVTLCVTNIMASVTLFLAEFLQFIYAMLSKSQFSCDARTISVQFMYSWGFCFQLLRSLELLCIHGEILTNSYFINPFLTIPISLIIPILQTVIAVGSWGANEIAKSICWLNLSGPVGLSYLILNLFTSWATLIVTESWFCSPFRRLRIRRQDSTSDLIFLTNLHFWFLFEVPLNYAAWVIGGVAVDNQDLFLFVVAAKLNIAVGVVTLLAQLGSTTRFCKIRRKLRVFRHVVIERPKLANHGFRFF